MAEVSCLPQQLRGFLWVLDPLLKIGLKYFCVLYICILFISHCPVEGKEITCRIETVIKGGACTK